MQTILEKLSGLPVLGPLFHRGPRVATIRLSGVISDTARRGVSHNKYAKLIEKAFALPRVSAVALVINSPGGSAAQSSLIANHVRRLAEEKKIPVLVFVEDVAASGGYWLACAGDEIYAQSTSIIGSIGVIAAGFGFDGFIRRHDIERRVHTAGKDKSFLDPFMPEKESDVQWLGAVMDELHGVFRDWVKSRRGDRLQGEDAALFEGNFWAAVPAQQKGLIDGIGDLRGVCIRKFGDQTRFVELVPDRKWFSLPFMGARGVDGLADDLLATVENRTLWSRFGL